MKTTLTDRFIKSRKLAAPGRRDDYPDALVPGLALRVTDRGHRSFVLVARFPANPKNPTRRALGDYGQITLEQARDRARTWLELISKGIDPKVAEARQRAETMRRHAVTFGRVAEEFLTRYAVKLSKADAARRIIEAEFVRRWRDRPATEILPEEAAEAIRAIVRRGAPYQAHSAFEWLRRLYNWSIGTHEFGVTSSPVAALRPADLIGKKEARDRVLTDDEVRKIWAACGGTVGAEALKEARRRDQERDDAAAVGYPYGPLVRLLLLTGQREREVAEMTWAEIDLDAAVWTVPASRMKSGRAHEVPLAPEAVKLLHALPRFSDGGYVFTTTSGRKPVNGFSKAKARLDKLSGVTGWRFHDLRRTMRTGLSALPIEDRVREAMIAHAAPGLHKVYDRHSYFSEKRRGFELWEQRLASVLKPKAAAVADLAAERAARRQ